MAASKYVTIMFIPDGAEARSGYRIPQWTLRFLLGVVALLVIGIMLFFIFYGRVVTRAALADKLQEENERLRRYQYKVQLLEENLTKARAIVMRLTTLAGIDIEFPEIPSDSTLMSPVEPSHKPVLSHAAGVDWSLPTGLPIQGFISQDFEILDGKHFHPGVDIACAEGTPVLATASGKVAYADFDSTYGYMVVIKHNDSVMTVYGHNKELLVSTGQEVAVGSRVALSGNTGKSSAPHLHYEIRINDEPIDPLDNPYDQKNEP